MTSEILDSVLPLAIHAFMQILDNAGARGSGFPEVAIDVIEEDGEALGSVAQHCGSGGAGGKSLEHDPGIAEMHLRAANRLAIVIVLAEPEDVR